MNLDSTIQKNSLHRGQMLAASGQSLVEFCGIFSILVMILLGGAGFGLAGYQMHMASDGILGPLAHLTEMANTPGVVSNGVISGYVNQSATGSISGNAVDSVTLDAEKGYFIGTKQTTSLSQWVPGMTIKVAQSIRPGFLMPISDGGAPARSASTPWVPGDTPQIPPWEGGPLAPGAEPPAAPTAP